MDTVITRIIDLPHGVNGLTVKDEEGDYNVYINSRLGDEGRVIAFRHEIEHILKGDFYSEDPVFIKEYRNRYK